MILPRYSLRAILLVTAICALASFIVSQGLRGKPWAAGVSMGLLAVALTLVLGALAFAALWMLGALLGQIGASRRETLRSDREADTGRAKPPVRG